jgi:sugar phosphate isomerase/epimerase
MPQFQHGVIGQGLNDYDRIFSILHGVNFRGWIPSRMVRIQRKA